MRPTRLFLRVGLLLSNVLFVGPAWATPDLAAPDCGFARLLDLPCERVPRGRAPRWVEVRPIDPLRADKAFALRFGRPTPTRWSRVEAQVGSKLQTALFVAALIVFLL